jgi:hypothetical protein
MAKFIVQGKPLEPEGIVKVTKATREEALATAIANGRVYTFEEFAMSI